MTRGNASPLEAAPCSRCGGAMEAGWIAARVGRIRWVPSSARWLRFIGGASLAWNWVVPPLIAANRCHSCGVGTFSYDVTIDGED